MTKVQALLALMRDRKGTATWSEIYENIEQYYPNATAAREWKAGLRGVLYREMRNGRHFKRIAKGTFMLR